MHIKLIDVPLYYGCDNPGTHLAPMTFSKNQIASLIEERGHQLDRLSIVPTPQNPTDKDAEPTMKYLNEVTYTCRQLADCVHSGRHNGQFPLVIGGDHALGLGSIAGLARSIPADQLSVIWIDAHTDINTNLTSPSHNIHGMPLAAALGLGTAACMKTWARRLRSCCRRISFTSAPAASTRARRRSSPPTTSAPSACQRFGRRALSSAPASCWTLSKPHTST